MQLELDAEHTRDYSGRPLVKLYGLSPRLVISGDLHPGDLHELARQLVTIAIDAEMIGATEGGEQ